MIRAEPGRDALEFAEGGWDAILLDAPCSATGTIRRHPDLPQARDGSEMPALIDLQARMIDHALSILRPGGRLVFATCSILPEEGRERVEAFLARSDGWTAVDELRRLPGPGGDGFFQAVLRRG